MNKWNMIKKNQNSNGEIISTGQTIIPMYDDNENDKLKNKVNELENKVDKILNILEKKID